jgi:hypothetical protein
MARSIRVLRRRSKEPDRRESGGLGGVGWGIVDRGPIRRSATELRPASFERLGGWIRTSDHRLQVRSTRDMRRHPSPAPAVRPASKSASGKKSRPVISGSGRSTRPLRHTDPHTVPTKAPASTPQTDRAPPRPSESHTRAPARTRARAREGFWGTTGARTHNPNKHRHLDHLSAPPKPTHPGKTPDVTRGGADRLRRR